MEQEAAGVGLAAVTTADIVLVIATVLMALATMAAAYAAWRSYQVAVLAPAEAAEAQARMAASSERRQHKMRIFIQVMMDRPNLFGRDTARSLNVVDIIYHDSSQVRRAWSSLHEALVRDEPPSDARRIEVRDKTNRLLEAMAGDLELAEALGPDDFKRIYYPNALSDDDQVALSQRQAALRHFRSLEQGELAGNPPGKRVDPGNPGR